MALFICCSARIEPAQRKRPQAANPVGPTLLYTSIYIACFRRIVAIKHKPIIKMNAHETQIISVTFEQLSERPSNYVFEISKAHMHLRQAEFVGAICLSFEPGAAWDGDIMISAKRVESSSDPEALRALAGQHAQLTTKPAIVTELSLYERRALAATRERLATDQRRVFGGLAVFRSTRGYRAGIFNNRPADAAFVSQITLCREEEAECRRTHEQVPEALAAMNAVLPHSPQDIEAFAHKRLTATILHTLSKLDISPQAINPTKSSEEPKAVRHLALLG